MWYREKELDTIIDKLESDDIYITEECTYRSYWDEDYEYYDDYWYGINDYFSRLNYSFDYFKFKSLVFSLALQSDNYSKEAFNINDYFSCYDSEIDLSYIYDKDKFNNRL